MSPSAPTPPASDAVVYKICPRADWVRAQALGLLAPSPDDARDGYVHLSRQSQLKGTLEHHFRGREDLVLLAVRTDRLLEHELRWELSRGGQWFPHLYGSLSVASVERVFELPLDLAGVHALPEGL
ncbi:MAG TPA: DUF952 domain-containing protein [Polyangiaceae bacterium]|nr:DUF952 domain-containing protein [Polyangiaceae bacterium]